MESLARLKPELALILGKCRRRLQAQRAMRPFLLVMPPQIFEHHPPLIQLIDQFPVQTFPSKPTFETFRISVLPRTAGLDVDRLVPIRFQPKLDDLGDKLRPVVTANVFWRTMLLNGFAQHP